MSLVPHHCPICGTTCGSHFPSIDGSARIVELEAQLELERREKKKLADMCAFAAGACIGLQFHDTMETVKPRLEELRETLEAALTPQEAPDGQ
jgi:hypothetical protein